MIYKSYFYIRYYIVFKIHTFCTRMTRCYHIVIMLCLSYTLDETIAQLFEAHNSDQSYDGMHYLRMREYAIC